MITDLPLPAHADEPKDLAVVFGVAKPPLPRPVCLADMLRNPPPTPPELIKGLLHQGSKMILAGTSKSNKSWCLLDLAASVASGQPWWGFQCKAGRVIYLNFELQDWAIDRRMRALYEARPECAAAAHNIHFWNLRGFGSDISKLRAELTNELALAGYAMILIDPVYKLLGDRDENSNTEVAQLLNELEQLAIVTEAAVVIAHHFAKGSAASKAPMDRMSGAGAWARDPDALLVLTPHEEEGCFVMTPVIRHFPASSEIVLEWQYPRMLLAPNLDPGALRNPQTPSKIITDHEFAQRFLSPVPQSRMTILEAAAAHNITRGTVDRYLGRLRASGLVVGGHGMYWTAPAAGTPPVPPPETTTQTNTPHDNDTTKPVAKPKKSPKAG